MASRTMHLAIAKKMKENNVINNYSRYVIGQILPDAITHGLVNHADSHFKVSVCDNRKKMIDFEEFRNKYSYEILSDDLYLGYYFHLIQDAIYRKFLYYDYGYTVTCREDVEVLHNDYRLLNSYLISKYQLDNYLVIPEEFEKDKINNIYPFSLDNYIEDTKNDFLPYHTGETKFFTEAMADEYINECFKLCYTELINLKEGKVYLKPMDYGWELPTKENR